MQEHLRTELLGGDYAACTIDGRRFDTGVPYGMMESQIALAKRYPSYAPRARNPAGDSEGAPLPCACTFGAIPCGVPGSVRGIAILLLAATPRSLWPPEKQYA